MSDEPLKFQNEEEKNAALTAIQDKPGGAGPEDMEEIDRISEAEVVDSPEEIPEDTGLPAEEKPPEEVEPEDDARQWTIDDTLISEYDDEYVDENGRRRKFITHKNPGDLLKSYVGAQKNNHYLKTQRIPQAHQEGYNKAKAEYEEKLQALQKENEAFKAQPPEKKEPPVRKEPVETDTLQKYNTLVEELKGISDEDSIEYTAKMKQAFVLQSELRQEESTRHADDINNLRTEITSDVTEKLTAYERKLAESENKRLDNLKAIKDEEDRNKILSNIYTEIDTFASEKDTPAEFKSDQKFSDMNAEAASFHNALGEAYTGKTSAFYSPGEWSKVMQQAELEYINGTPALLEKAKSIGLNEPKNYQVWKRLDAIDAMRTGYIRNPTTNVWEQRFNPHDGKQVNLGDIKTAYNYYLDESGLREKKASEKTKKEVNQVVDVINKRDKGMTQLDESTLSQEGDGTTLTEAQAQEFLQNVDMDYVMAEQMKGNLEPLQKLNAAQDRLKGEPVPVLYKR
jgi:hypothetical protein